MKPFMLGHIGIEILTYPVGFYSFGVSFSQLSADRTIEVDFFRLHMRLWLCVDYKCKSWCK